MAEDQAKSRLLLLLPTKTYRAEAFLRAAERMGAEVVTVVASEQASILEAKQPERLLTLDFADPAEAAHKAVTFARTHRIDAVVPVDDDTAVLAAAVAEALDLPHNSVASAAAARNKHRMREILRVAGVPVPNFVLFSTHDNPAATAQRVEYPCVLKPLFLAASCGVIRANDEAEFVVAFRRIAAILAEPDVSRRGGALARNILAEEFIPGVEVALEGLLDRGEMRVLALFDKPDPLDGPFFEETIYVTPSRLAGAVQEEIASLAARAAHALGLTGGPVHAELRIQEKGPIVIEVAARSIGGLCSRTLRFATGLALEDLILRHALGRDLDAIASDKTPAGVMMIPIPKAGILREVRGLAAARDVPGIEDVVITEHPNQCLVPVPEGSRYLGFIFARANDPERIVEALRLAHRRIEMVID